MASRAGGRERTEKKAIQQMIRWRGECAKFNQMRVFYLDTVRILIWDIRYNI